MRCANCGFPLSPSRANCPRCGASTTGGSEVRAPQPGTGIPDVGSMQPHSSNAGNVQVSTETAPPWGNYAPATPWQSQGMPFAQPVTPSPVYQQSGNEVRDQIPFSTQGTANLSPADNPLAKRPPDTQAGRPDYPWPAAGSMDASPGNWAPTPQPGWGALSAQQQPVTQTSSKAGWQSRLKLNKRNGFTIATLCLVSGALLLIIVHFIALGLPTSSAQAAITNNTPIVKTTAATAAPTVAVTPTPMSLPGQQYIDNAQTATGITPNSQPVGVTSNFKVGQRIYATFTLHPGGQNGEVCVYWYLNNQQFFHYPFSSGAIGGDSYSYTPVGATTTTGPGYVELYWAWSSTCLDKVMAQHVDFTVSG